MGHSMGAKAAMVVALRSPSLIANLIPIDNSPVDAALKSDFGQYVLGMRKIEEANVTKQSEADQILQQYEEVRISTSLSLPPYETKQDRSGGIMVNNKGIKHAQLNKDILQ